MEPPLGPAVLEAACCAAGRAQDADGLVGVGAERTAAVGDDLALLRQLGEPPFQLVMWDRARAVDVAGGELVRRAHVDQHGVAARETLAQLVAVDRLDLLAEVVARGALDLGELAGGGVAQREPQPQRLVAGERVTDARAVARAGHEARRVQRLEVLRGVRE